MMRDMSLALDSFDDSFPDIIVGKCRFDDLKLLRIEGKEMVHRLSEIL